MVDIHHEASCAAPVDVAFGYLDDYRTGTEWMFGLAELSPVDERDHGLGAMFDATFHVRPVKLHSRVKVTEWEQDEVLGFVSVQGFVNSSTWRFRRDGAAHTTIVVRFSYELPGGLAGRALGRALEPIVALSVRQSEHALRRAIETRYRDATRRRSDDARD
ncbi:MAG TPA: SRPBCC family protein [Jatrophihabitans sp.]|nr:SRPBCC family protein [Jatrophihabitans sp.]